MSNSCYWLFLFVCVHLNDPGKTPSKPHIALKFLTRIDVTFQLAFFQVLRYLLSHLLA